MSDYPKRARIKDVDIKSRTWNGNRTLDVGSIVSVVKEYSKQSFGIVDPILGKTWQGTEIWIACGSILEFIDDPIPTEADCDPVIRPNYYLLPNGIECKDVTRYFGFDCGNAIKYLWRAGRKGNAIEDYKKARQYIDFLIEYAETIEDKP